MKTFRFIGMALFAVLMCVNFAACSSSDDDPTEEKEEGEVVVSGKKLAKIVITGSYENETYTFKYDDKGRLINATESYEYYYGDEHQYLNKKSREYQYVWGDDAIKVNYCHNSNAGSFPNTYILTLKNGLVQNGDEGDFIYNKSNRLIRIESQTYTTTAIWDGDKLVSISDASEGDGGDATLSYGQSCKKGYFPFIAYMIGGRDIIFMAHPEIAGMRTNQLPTSVTWTEKDYYTGKTESSTSTLTYEFDKEGYILKVNSKDEDGSSWTYTLTWQ